MTDKHTPGPWEFEDKREGSLRVGDLTGPDGVIVHETESDWCGGWEHAISPADACLIEAAPDLLEALEEIALLPVAKPYPDGPCISQEDMDMVRAAISKAKGETDD